MRRLALGIMWIVALAAAGAAGCGGDRPQERSGSDDGARAKPPATADLRQAAVGGPMGGTVSEENIERSLAAAQEYLQSQKVAEAKAVLFTLIDRAPGEVRARELLGQALTMEAELAERKGESGTALRQQAYAAYVRVVELEPGSAGLQHSAGLMAQAAGKTAEALAHFQAASRLEPANPQYPLFEAQLLIQAQRLDEAQAALERVLRLDPHEPLAHASLAMIELERGRFDLSLERMRAARALSPGDVQLRAQEAKIQRRKGDARAALELLIGLGERERANHAVAFEIAASYELLEQPMKAAEAWAHAFNTDPLHRQAWLAAVRAGAALLKAGERDQAWIWLQQAKRQAPPDAKELRELEERME